THSRHSPVSHSHPVTNYHLQTAQTNPRICLIIEIHSEGMQVLGLLGFGKGKRQYLVSNEGLRKGCLPQQLMLYPGQRIQTENQAFEPQQIFHHDDLVENFKEGLNKENYEELHFPFSENTPIGRGTSENE
ncbi:hypothetical protein CAPTEDRAFT_195771, partial [Capitella teleta]